jgi:bifunctional DNase/RNase
MQPAPFAYFCAVARLHNGDTVQELDIRPSDALSLALLMEGPIFVSNALLEQSGIVLSEDQTPELYFAEQLLKQEGITLPEGKKLRLGYSKTPACDALIKEFKAALLGKPQLFPEQDLEQAKKNYLFFILGTNN